MLWSIQLPYVDYYFIFGKHCYVLEYKEWLHFGELKHLPWHLQKLNNEKEQIKHRKNMNVNEYTRHESLA
jgi:hypothetical protein